MIFEFIFLLSILLCVYIILEIAHYLTYKTFRVEYLFIRKNFLIDLKKLHRKDWYFKIYIFNLKLREKYDWKGKRIKKLGYKIFVEAKNQKLHSWTIDELILDIKGHIISEKLTKGMKREEEWQ